MIGWAHQKKDNPLACTCTWECWWDNFNEMAMRFLSIQFGRPHDLLPHITFGLAQDLEESTTRVRTLETGDHSAQLDKCCNVKGFSDWRSVTQISPRFDLEWTTVTLHQAEDWRNLHLVIHLHERQGGINQHNHLDLSLVQLKRVLREMKIISRFSGALKLFEPCNLKPVWNKSLLNDDGLPHNVHHPLDLRLCLYRVCKIHTCHLDDYLLHIEHWEYASLDRRIVIRLKEEEYQKLEDLSLLLTQLYGSGNGFIVEKTVLQTEIPKCLGLLGAYRINTEHLPFLPKGKKRHVPNHHKYLNNSLLCYQLKEDCSAYDSSRLYQRFEDQVEEKLRQMKKRVKARRDLDDARVLVELPNWEENEESVPDTDEDGFAKYLAELPNWCEED